MSLTNHLTVYFDTNDRKTDQGFKAHYKAVTPELTSGTMTIWKIHFSMKIVSILTYVYMTGLQYRLDLES